MQIKAERASRMTQLHLCTALDSVLRSVCTPSFLLAVILVGDLAAIAPAFDDGSSVHRHRASSARLGPASHLHSARPIIAIGVNRIAHKQRLPDSDVHVTSRSTATGDDVDTGASNGRHLAATRTSSLKSGHVIDDVDRREATVRELQDLAMKLFGVQAEYDRGLQDVSDMVETLRKDVERLRNRRPDAIGAQSYNNVTYDATSIVQLTKSVRNVTAVLQKQVSQLSKVRRRSKHTQLAVSNIQIGLGRTLVAVSDSSAASKYCNDALQDLGTKQTEINANLMRKIMVLEKMVTESRTMPSIGQHSKYAPADSPLSAGPSCPPDYIHHAFSCYKFENRLLNWIDAEKHCQVNHPDAHLVAIETKAEMDTIVDYRLHNNAKWNSRYIWTGANDMVSEGSWTWVGTGRALIDGFSDWRTGQPDNHNGNQHCMYARIEASPVDTGLHIRSPSTSGTSSKSNNAATSRLQHKATGMPSGTEADWQDAGNSRWVEGKGTGSWDDWQCYAAKLNFVCEIVLQP